MKKLLIITIALVMTLSVGYITLASTIGIGATEGYQVEVIKQIDPSDDDILVTGYYGVNEQLQLSLGYYTDSKDLELGVRYAFDKNMAVTLDYVMPDDEDADNTATFGFRYKAQISDPLALVGVFEFKNTDPDETIEVIGQAEYSFNDMIIGTLGFDHYEIGDYDGTNIIVGIETYPIKALCVYLDYTIVDEETDDDTLELGVCYAF